jgi:ribosomal protein S27AE
MTDNKKAVILRGNFSDGYTVIGPFDSFDAAATYDDYALGGGGWIAGIEAPEPTCDTCGVEVSHDDDRRCGKCYATDGAP